MTYFLIAGEASGDLHASNLMRGIAARDEQAVFIGFGGEKMQKAGCRLLLHYRDMAYMGVVAVLKNIGKVSRNMRLAKQSLLDIRPDVLILIDYPTFNLHVAEFTRKHLPDTKIYYYIPPKVWVWKTWRIHRIARCCDRIMCIFPFEPAFYARYGYHAEYVGNPTAEELGCGSQESAINNQQSKIIALLPGSREHEIRRCLPRMLAAAARFPEYDIVVSKAPSVDTEVYEQTIARAIKKYCLGGVRYTFTTDTRGLLRKAAVAVVNSGTATLEAAILGCPQVAVYHLACSHLLEVLKPVLFKTRFFTLPNIILDKEVICELLGYQFSVDSVAAELQLLLEDSDYRNRMLRDYDNIRHSLSPSARKD